MNNKDNARAKRLYNIVSIRKCEKPIFFMAIPADNNKKDRHSSLIDTPSGKPSPSAFPPPARPLQTNHPPQPNESERGKEKGRREFMGDARGACTRHVAARRFSLFSFFFFFFFCKVQRLRVIALARVCALLKMKRGRRKEQFTCYSDFSSVGERALKILARSLTL